VQLATSRTSNTPLSVELLLQLQPVLTGAGGKVERRLWAACCLGVSALARPGELFGRPAGVKARAPPRRDAIRFLSAASTVVLDGSPTPPTAFEWHVGPTKTDPAGKQSRKLVGAAHAVRGLWEWCALRHACGEQSPVLFAIDGATITEYSVLAALAAAHVKHGLGPASFGGKCFRQGGAATLVAAGVPNEDVMRAGRWRSSGMPNLYAGQSAVDRRRLVVSAASDPSWRPGPASGSR
jgi:hypothetical protein